MLKIYADNPKPKEFITNLKQNIKRKKKHPKKSVFKNGLVNV